MKTPKTVEGVECRECGDRIWSRSVHDFRTCKCGAVFVDGGREYIRWGSTRKCKDPKRVRIKLAAEPRSDEPAKCPSCGVAYEDHLGFNGTCHGYRELLSLLRDIAATEQPKSRRLKAERELARVLRLASGAVAFHDSLAEERRKACAARRERERKDGLL